MSAAATTAQSAPDQSELYQLRDDLAKTYNPENAHERMLVTQIAQSWIRLERAHDLERRYFEGRDMLEIIRTKLAEFKAITRYVTDCERAWRHATLSLQKSQRQRVRATLASPLARRPVDRPARLRPLRHSPRRRPPPPCIPSASDTRLPHGQKAARITRPPGPSKDRPVAAPQVFDNPTNSGLAPP